MSQLRNFHFGGAPALLPLILGLACFPACSRDGDPQAVLDHATRTFQHGKLAAATTEAKTGCTRFRRISAEWAWRFLILEANALTWQGLKHEALSVLATEGVPPSDELKAQKDWIEASALTFLHRFGEAQSKLEDMERLCTAADYAVCVDYRPRGWFEMYRGDLQEAAVYFTKTLAAARARNDQFLRANALLALSATALQQEHFEQALDWASAAYRDSAAMDAESVAQGALGNEGWAYYRLGEPEKAFGLFIEARQRAHKIGANSAEVKWVTTAGYVYLDAHQYDKAGQSYHQALDLAKSIDSREDVINALMSLALVSERAGNLEQARDYADQAISLVPPNGNRLDVLYPLLVKGRIAGRLHDTAQAEKTLREIERESTNDVFLKWESEHSLAQLYEEQNQLGMADREYLAALRTYETARSSLKQLESELPFPANAAGIYDDYVHFLVNHGKAAEALQVADHSRGRTLTEAMGALRQKDPVLPAPVAAQGIAHAARAALLYYWLGEKESFLWAVTAKRTELFHLPPASEINAMVQRHRRVVESAEDVIDASNSDAMNLYRTLVQPSKDTLGENARIVILASGSLNQLNFETLVVPDPKPHYWIDDVTILNAPSLRLLGASFRGQPSSGKLLIIGDPVMPSPEFATPPKAALEIEKIKQHFPSSDQEILAKERATPNAYLTSPLEQFSYIHFVTHGTASQITPLDSSIILSKNNGQDAAFRLYARDIVAHPLRAELVTISACYGAGSRVYSGEGLVGLSWAFLRAGARYVIGALWDVSDASSPQLMEKMYSEITAGKAPEEALRLAKLSLLHSDTAFRKPFYWAPFQIYTGSYEHGM